MINTDALGQRRLGSNVTSPLYDDNPTQLRNTGPRCLPLRRKHLVHNMAEDLCQSLFLWQQTRTLAGEGETSRSIPRGEPLTA